MKAKWVDLLLLYGVFALGLLLPYSRLLPYVVMLASVLGLLCVLAGRWKFRLNVVDVMMLLFFGIVMASQAWSYFPSQTRFYVGQNLPACIVVFLLLRLSTELSPSALPWFSAGGVIGFVLIAIFRILASTQSWSESFYWLDPFIVDVVKFGSYAALALPLGLSLLLRDDYVKSRGGKFLLAAFLFLLLYGGVVLASRMLFLAFACASLVLLIILMLLNDVPNKIFLRLVLSLFALLSGVLFLSILYIKSLIFFRYESPFIQTFADTERWYIWRHWLLLYWEHGYWLGWGYGFGIPSGVMNQYQATPVGVPSIWFVHGHNYLLNMFLQVGWPGLLLLLGILVGCAATFWRALRSTKFEAKWLAMFGMQFLLIFLLKNATDDGVSEGGMVLAFATLTSWHACCLNYLRNDTGLER